MYVVFHSNFAAYIVYRGYKPCEFLEFVWTDCWGNKSNYVITSPANCDRFDRGSRQVKREPVDLLMEDYDVSLSQRVGTHNYYTKDHIITCDMCTSGKFYSFVRWIIWWQITSDEDAWRPLIRFGITCICILWFWDILSCGMSWNIWNWLYYQLFWRELYF